MNPSASRIWNIPPPPGTEEELSNTSSKVEGSITSGSRTIDRIDPYLKSPEYVDFEKKNVEPSKYRSRSKSREKHHRRRHSRSRSRNRHSRSRDRYRRSRSRSHRRHRRKRSSSRSRSKSPSYRHRRRHGRYRRSTSRYSRSRSRSPSRSRSHRSHRPKSDRDKKSKTPKKSPDEKPVLDADTNEVDMKIEEEEEEEEEEQFKCAFKNDGSFLEMFKKMQEQQKAQEAVTSTEEKKPLVPAFGKRRGGKVLKTGLVQKVRLTTDEESNAQDAWSVYMKEVRRYKEACCDDDSKTRPLVK